MQWNTVNVKERRAPSDPTETLGIGERLRNAREAKGLTLAAAETLVRIRAVYLQALEEEQFDRVPAAVYARGYLRTYALALGLDPDALAEAYPTAFAVLAEPVVPSFPTQIPIRPAVPPSRARRIAMYVGGSVLLIIAILGFIGYQQLRQFAQPVSNPAPPPAVVSEPGRPPGRAEPVPAQVGPERPTVQSAPTVVAGVELRVTAAGTSWLRVLVDGEEVFQGLVNAGDVKTWQARERLTIRVGNTAAVRVLVNGQPVPLDPQRRVWEETFTTP